MPKDKPKSTQSLADALIAEAKSKGAHADPSPEGMAELKKIIEYNDTTSGTKISRNAAIAVLKKLGWVGRSTHGLDTMCRRLLNRSSFGQP